MTRGLHPVISEIGLRDILVTLGATKIRDNGTHYLFSSPFRTDKNPSMACYKNSAHCIDFGGSFRGSVFKLCWAMTGHNLFDFFEVAGSDSEDKIDSFFKRDRPKPLPEYYNKPETAEFQAAPEVIVKSDVEVLGEINYDFTSNPQVKAYCESRGIEADFWDHFKMGWTRICYANTTRFMDRVLIPVTHNQRMVSLEGRDFTGDQLPKVLYPKGGSVSTLFNLDKLDRSKPLIVTEGIMDTVKVWKHVNQNVTATFGIQLTPNQQQLLQEFDKVILFPDGDEGGVRFIRNFDAFYPKEFQVAMINGKDPGEATVPEIKKALQDSESITDYLIDRAGLFEPAKQVAW